MKTPEATLSVGFDSDLLYSGMTGVGNYCFHLLRALMLDYAELRFFGFGGLNWEEIGPADLDSIERFQSKCLPEQGLNAETAGQRLWQMKNAMRTRLARIDAVRSGYRHLRSLTFRTRRQPSALDLFHAFKYLPVGELAVPTLPVVYDLSFVRYPETHPRQRLRDLERLPAVIARAPLVHTISEFSKSEIVGVFGTSPGKIFVAPPAASRIFQPLGDCATRADIKKFDLSLHSYLLTVGTLEPRKNLKTLIAAYAQLAPAERDRAPLVVVGNAGWGDLDLPREAVSLKSDGTLRFLGAVSDVQLRSLYEGAIALVLPSIYEGFGMPVVEALACGTQVAHSLNTSMESITDGVATLRAPATDVTAWRIMLQELMGDLSRIFDKRDARIARARKFCWHQSATIVREAYSEANA
ncbi:alpha-1,3-rhamnosyl/mannosyltransferase [Bradyrhizobium sp. USDA 4532]|uniref:glycosyltransferase family 4 protein n=1 Tax=unclassified Bradyrhizobium TaxID=2631580 RepID=UPI0020A07548|nr:MULTISPECIES: glycosyltransferase family 1 protein [unclassified Bradyrhizobium]MCP1831682.1 alpha-1,3-rhamnosyl/mannosyltransferase [Bradyrhizobium sp. USDA 4545]MCP1916519.1 alpha-1,3-rhamnosyl/mannosyltransferase [Bradyrhizobium sp. USDA 4532]